MINNIIKFLNYDEATASLTYHKERMFLLHANVLAEILASFSEFAQEIDTEKVKQILYSIGFNYGSRLAERYTAQVEGGGKFIAFMCRITREMGLGNFEPVELDWQGKQLTFEVTNSVLVQENYQELKINPCAFFKGFLAGISEAIFEGKKTVEEIECVNNGDPSCIFIIKQS